MLSVVTRLAVAVVQVALVEIQAAQTSATMVVGVG